MKKYLFLLVVSLVFSGLAAAQEPVVDMQRAMGYLLSPGDEITVKVLGETQFDFVSTVNPEGNIEVPFMEEAISAKCKTERQLRGDITTHLAKYLKTPQISLSIKRNGRPPATISGEVVSPQQVVLMRKARLLELLSLAGGPKEEAGGSVQVFRTQEPVCAEDKEDSNWQANGSDATNAASRIYRLNNVRLGRDDSNPIIYPGDVIVVEKAPPVYVIGEVTTPQGVYIKEHGMTLGEAIAKIGGVKREAKTKDIKVYRLKPNSKDREIISANYDLIKKGQQKDILLEPYDIIEVDKAKDSIAQTILKLAIGAGKSTLGSLTGGIGYRVLY
jgi:polysaccharide export outer membrane protein